MIPTAGAIDAPAKINLTLEVLARRADGYHGVRSVMLPIAVHDVVRWEPAPRFAFSAAGGSLENDENLVVRALRALGPDPGLHVRLEKSIPVGGGLGGGSSDAAAILRAAARGAFGELGERDYVAIARRLGSDVPFFLVETGALVEGTGERVTALGALPPWWIVLIVPPVAVATGAAYAALDAARGADYTSRPRLGSASLAALAAVQRGDFETVASVAMNDFEPVVAEREPEIARALAALREAGSRLAMLSGSGACCFALAETQAEANAIAARLPSGTDASVVSFAPSGAWRS